MNNTIKQQSLTVSEKRYRQAKLAATICVLRILILIGLFVLLSFLGAKAQQISIDVKGEPLEAVLKQIRSQSGYSYAIKQEHIDRALPVTAKVNKEKLKIVLDLIFKNQPLNYHLEDKFILITGKEPKKFPRPMLKSKVVGELDQPLQGATIRVKRTAEMTMTDAEGSFELPEKYKGQLVEIAFVGYEKIEVPFHENIAIMLHPSRSILDEAVVIAYGSTTRRLNTGSVSKVTADDLSRQPANNVLGALSGRIPGLEVTQSSGAPGSSFNLQIRGRNSIGQGSQPLILIDGIPFAPQNENINVLNSAIANPQNDGGVSPFFSINPNDIESIEVLKDADATAIYGSRGANGVILITTKKGKEGKTQISLSMVHGFNKTPAGIQTMNTAQYLEMRREAFKNSATEPTNDNAPDLMVWDKNRYTDLRKLLLGNTGKTTNIQASLSGGNANTKFLIGTAYFRESLALPVQFPNNRSSVNLNLNHTALDQKLEINISGAFSSTVNRSTLSDLTYYTFLPPNIPSFTAPDGSLKWEENNIYYDNPLGIFLQKYRSMGSNLVSSLNLKYALNPNLSLKLLAGFNEFNNQEVQTLPRSSYSPALDMNSSSSFGDSRFVNWNIEPQAEYNNKTRIGKFNFLLGVTFQDRQKSGSSMKLTGFSSDALLESAQAANMVTSKTSSYSQYRYEALFGRVNYNLDDKYLINLTARRDGSSRFGTGRQFANFGALGAAWIFSDEKFIKGRLPFLTFGKLRGSYGITGNDQIGDYQYLDAWGSFTTRAYQNQSTLNPLNLFNPNYGWEKNKKLEAAIELGFFKNRLFMTLNYYRNRSSNQLVQYSLPTTTGFTSIIKNLPALVQNKGWELQLNADLWKAKDFSWTGSVNLSIPKNTLLSFPGIETSSYRYSYVEGQSLNLIYRYQSLGVNSENGLYHYKDQNDDQLFSPADYVVRGHTDPEFFGGFRNTFRYKGLMLDMLFDFKKQTGRNLLYSISENGFQPGTMWNQPEILEDRWRNPGDHARFEKAYPFTITERNSPISSDAVYSDQSFIRLRSLHISYNFSAECLSAIKAKSLTIYCQGQNLATWNKDKNYDPEIQGLYRMPTYRTFTLGVQLSY